ncbi:methylated-DNA--[protein]-cysteine S-methyltransferase [Methylocystis sp. H4A]|uniref:methylated-DNA--[protein]-cysteine S-methyltransferase n=1 Tax=Methylocystis sp. H4A TaxID=2785788 RepID=UPI0018C1D274|nr:methylated-DNA--[protein]-cysteine S-methyltransferase [Methylocystis sp. H4A]MBG0800725.1 methylated-DNA--[protein]-cysteine S-methyltransferase [Methylocystis sp. H4A]
MQRFHIFQTAIGPCGIAWSEEGVTRFQLPERDDSALARRMAKADRWSAALPSPIAQAIADLERYFRGEKVDFSTLRLDLRACSPFHKAVYDATRAIGWGAVATYGEIARGVGSPGAARAVGHALSRNPIAIIIPCHRILAAGGKIGGFSAHGGASAKARLLEIEGARFGQGAAANPDIFAPSFG